MNQPLTIILINSGRKWIGEIEHVAILYEQLDKAGHRPWIACRKGYSLEKHALKSAWRCLPLYLNNRFNPVQDLSDVIALRKLAKKEQVDLLHVHRGKEHWLGAMVSALGRIPLIRTRHVMTLVRHHLLNRILYEHFTDHIICVSHAVAQGYRKGFHRLPSMDIIHSAVDLEKFHPRHASEKMRTDLLKGSRVTENPIVFGLFGRFQKIKGQEIFIRAAARICREYDHVFFYMAGPRGIKRGRLQAEMARTQYGLDGRIKADGKRDDLPEVLASIDVGVIASTGSEGSSRIALEMMASGLPVIATQVGGIPELADQCPGLILVNPGDDAMLAAEMKKCIESYRLEDLGCASRKHVVMKNQPSAWIERIIQVYRKYA
jgi:glycosyltransferase involved in cell wall biosynthesis